ncbi:MAG: pimelyl-ACP methyl ester esterase BioV [Helicobacteraceae bacterium]|nr:pimelyl-ACP methyl ester esterase BioV [Helicobacteraceae bacterium]
MTFFSGFGFANEAELFADYLPSGASAHCVAGFSLGAIKAFQCAIASDFRIDRLILLSPAFFQDKDRKFARLQLINYARDGASYMRNFYAACGKFNAKYIDPNPQADDLRKSLNHQWSLDMFDSLKNLQIEIYLGGKDNIINSEKAAEFFSKTHAQTTYIKNANHLLQIEEQTI